MALRGMMDDPQRLGRFEELVLLALVRLRTNAYGVTIRRELVERTGREISLGAVYTTLDRLEGKGYVSSKWGESSAERGGRAKRYFVIEAPGRRALSSTHDLIIKMAAGVSYA